MAEYKVLEFMVGSYGTKKWLERLVCKNYSMLMRTVHVAYLVICTSEKDNSVSGYTFQHGKA